ncbi:hypothetical protein [Bacillus sp. FSL K6-3431]|uniref:hypothetical protein n=1 Tax=Bacillus sp. FSL K6-3431 TaxID=2921500 RepID=UPI0030F939E6
MNIQSIMAKATGAVEFMYDKEAEIKRYEEIVKQNGADGMEWITKHSDVPCRLSSSKLDNTAQGEANAINYDVKMFLSSHIEIRAGDILIVNGEKYESTKKPFVYVSHQEVLLEYKGYA